MQKSFAIAGPGEFVTRDGRFAVVLAIVGDQAFGYIEDSDGFRFSDDWYADTGMIFHDEQQGEDIVGVWIEEKEEEAMKNPFAITGPGEFVTANNRRATVLAVVGKLAIGYITDGDGFLHAEDWFADDGRFRISSAAAEDIVGIWAPPARIKMYMYKLNGAVRGYDSPMLYTCGWKLVAKGELVEGDGMDDE